MVHFYVFLIVLLHIKRANSINKSLEGKIVGGEYDSIQNHPHAVFLEITNNDLSAHICGSSVLTHRVLISAAHCINRVKPNGRIVALAGHENLKMAKIVRRVTKFRIHQYYNLDTTENDISLLLLNKPLPLGRYIKRIAVARNFPRSTKGMVAGWGVTNDITAKETFLLKTLSQTIRNADVCNRLQISSGMFCAGSMKSSAPRPSGGDSGSGLIASNYQLVGLVSYRLVSYPALTVYTNVPHYYNWIKQESIKIYCS